MCSTTASSDAASREALAIGGGFLIPTRRLIRAVTCLMDCCGAPDSTRLTSQDIVRWAVQPRGIALHFIAPAGATTPRTACSS